MATNSIAGYEFAWMSEPPKITHLQTYARVRPGANGVLVQTLGYWAQPFEIVTKTVAANVFSAYQAYVAYTTLIGVACPVIWADLPFEAKAEYFWVMDVDLISAKRIVAGVGPTGVYFAETLTRWRLQPVLLG